MFIISLYTGICYTFEDLYPQPSPAEAKETQFFLDLNNLFKTLYVLQKMRA